MELITRKEAKSLGKTRYFTGLSCKEGHIAERRVDSGSCAECTRLWTKRWRDNGCVPQDSYNSQGKLLPELNYLLECFEYKEGKLFWKARPPSHFNTLRTYRSFTTRSSGKEAGHNHKSNHYNEIRLDGKLYKAHRIIFKMFHGRDPQDCIDHVDGDPTNNRIENLREATQQENTRNMAKLPNKSSQYKGVSKRGNSWISSIWVNDSAMSVKCGSEMEAALMYDKLAREHFGEFANLNFKEE